MSAASGSATRLWWVAGVLALIAAAAISLALVASGGDDELGDDYRIVVPDGTWQRIRAGEEVALIPRRLQLYTGDTLVIVNNDTEAHQVGPYVVPAGDTLTQEYPDPGVISQGLCTLHPDGRVEIVISERS